MRKYSNSSRRDYYSSLYKSRESKVANPKSRLYAKAALAKKIDDAKELNNLSTFGVSMDKKHFHEFIRKYSGVDAEGGPLTDEKKKEGRFDAMLSVTEQFMKIKLLAANSDFLDQLTAKDNQVQITKDMIENQITRCKAYSDYYCVRKMILTNPYYKTHYNEELSMNVDAGATFEQKHLAKLLRMSYYLAKNLNTQDPLAEPKKNQRKKEYADEVQGQLSVEEDAIHFAEKAGSLSDAFDKRVRKTSLNRTDRYDDEVLTEAIKERDKLLTELEREHLHTSFYHEAYREYHEEEDHG